MAPQFEHNQAEEIRDAFARHGVRYLFLGRSGAILLGYPQTATEVRDRLVAAVGGHVGDRPPSDDRTLVVMRYRSSGSLTGEIPLSELAGVLAEARSALP